MLFQNITGQTAIKQKLIQSVQDNRVSHAQLFYGPEGSGKLALAIAYAQFINCRNKKVLDDGTMDSCGSCPSCIKYDKLVHPDLHFIYPVATTRKVPAKPKSRDFVTEWRNTLLEKQFRLSLNDWHKAIGIEKKQGSINTYDCSEILRTLSYKSYESEFKVMVIWMVEKLHHMAAPKILKILEEPPEKTLFLLISEQPEQVINTIRSRTQFVRIPKLGDMELEETLIKQYDASAEEARKAALLANGNLIAAVKIIQQVEENTFLTDTFIRWMRLCYELKISDLNNFILEISRLGREKQKNFLNYASGMIRNCMLINYSVSSQARMNEEEFEFLKKFALVINEKNLVRIAEEIDKAQYHIERNAYPNITFMDLSLTLTKLLRQ